MTFGSETLSEAENLSAAEAIEAVLARGPSVEPDKFTTDLAWHAKIAREARKLSGTVEIQSHTKQTSISVSALATNYLL